MLGPAHADVRARPDVRGRAPRSGRPRGRRWIRAGEVSVPRDARTRVGRGARSSRRARALRARRAEASRLRGPRRSERGDLTIPVSGNASRKPGKRRELPNTPPSLWRWAGHRKQRVPCRTPTPPPSSRWSRSSSTKSQLRQSRWAARTTTTSRSRLLRRQRFRPCTEASRRARSCRRSASRKRRRSRFRRCTAGSRRARNSRRSDGMCRRRRPRNPR